MTNKSVLELLISSVLEGVSYQSAVVVKLEGNKVTFSQEGQGILTVEYNTNKPLEFLLNSEDYDCDIVQYSSVEQVVSQLSSYVLSKVRRNGKLECSIYVVENTNNGLVRYTKKDYYFKVSPNSILANLTTRVAFGDEVVVHNDHFYRGLSDSKPNIIALLNI